MDIKNNEEKTIFISSAAQGLIGQIEGLISLIKSQVLRGYIMRWLQIGRSTGDVGYLASVLRHAQSAIDADELHAYRESNKASGSGVITPVSVDQIDHSKAMKAVETLLQEIEKDLERVLSQNIQNNIDQENNA